MRSYWLKIGLIINHLHRKQFKSIFIFNLNGIVDIVEIEHDYNTANLNEKISKPLDQEARFYIKITFAAYFRSGLKYETLSKAKSLTKRFK